MDENENIPAPAVDDPAKIDNKWELLAYIIKYWWKAALLAVVVALALTGYEITCGDVKFNHEPVKQLEEVAK